MGLRLSVLASGSSGNSIFVASANTAVLIDAGISCRQISSRLASIGEDLASVQAVCVTHEHDDHKSALGVLHRRTGMALYGNRGTIEAIERRLPGAPLPWNVFTTGAPFAVGDLHVEPFSVPHDSYDPVGFIVSCNGVRVGVVTDMGMATGVVRTRLKGCAALVLESNHDPEMLRDCSRPWTLKQRIAGRQGHLSNEQAGQLICEVAGRDLKTVFLAHLSGDCNRPDLAVRTVRRILESNGLGHLDVRVTYPDRPTECVGCGVKPAVDVATT